jgi:hypothetical protein
MAQFAAHLADDCRLRHADGYHRLADLRRIGRVWAVLLTGFGLWQASRVSPKMVLKLYKARALTEREVPQLHQIMRELTARADLPSVPDLYYVPSK